MDLKSNWYTLRWDWTLISKCWFNPLECTYSPVILHIYRTLPYCVPQRDLIPYTHFFLIRSPVQIWLNLMYTHFLFLFFFLRLMNKFFYIGYNQPKTGKCVENIIFYVVNNQTSVDNKYFHIRLGILIRKWVNFQNHCRVKICHRIYIYGVSNT